MIVLSKAGANTADIRIINSLLLETPIKTGSSRWHRSHRRIDHTNTVSQCNKQNNQSLKSVTIIKVLCVCVCVCLCVRACVRACVRVRSTCVHNIHVPYYANF